MEKSGLTSRPPRAYIIATFNACGAIALQSQSERVLGKFGDDLNEIADRLGWPYKRLWNWKAKGQIPQDWHQPLLNKASELSVNLKPMDFVAHLHRPAAAPEHVKQAG